MVKELHICLNMVSDPTWSGGVLYIQNLVKAIASLPTKEQENIRLSLAVDKSNLRLAEPVREQVAHIYADGSFENGYLRICKALAMYAPFIPLRLLNPRSYDFIYPHCARVRAAYKWGGWIPDFQHYHLPHLFTPKEMAVRDTLTKKIADAAPVIVLSSQMAQADFCNIHPYACDRSTVMHFASSTEPSWFELDPKIIQTQYNLPNDFFLVSNQFWQHKDHTVIIEALAILKERKIFPTVVCTGSTTDYRNPEYFKQLLSSIERLGLKENLRVLGLIPRIEQIQLMRRCIAIIQPSLFEGWSTVIEDARMLGKPILVSDFPVHLEQNPPHAYFFERRNAEQLAELISYTFTSLKSGPDLELENSARQDNLIRVEMYGKRFLEIVNTVL
ncbi:Glycosyl transferase family 1 domain-containing protein [Tumidithrix helvetica PCC 7403]|uniref:glycosyltransferase family 4 protein n=1 Tax=Tumidithrix helvetica TaxID=3457545 RepID=UPI003CACF758